jgi:hypothetical protein
MKRWRFDISIGIFVVIVVHRFAPGREAHADRGEASVHTQVQSGQATLGELESPGASDTAPFLGVGARATYAISNWYAFEASLGHGWLTRTAHYSLEPRTGLERHWNMSWTQVNLGIIARLGVRFIPTLHVSLGVQHRAWQGRERERKSLDCPPKEEEDLPMPCITDLDRQSTMELVGTLGTGVDYRLGEHWITGLAVSAQRTMVAESPFQTIVATFHISYYFYPEGAGL